MPAWAWWLAIGLALAAGVIIGGAVLFAFVHAMKLV